MSTQIQEKDFESIYRNTYSKVLRFIVIKCNNIDDVNDIIQDTYLEFLNILKRKQILQLDKPENYLFGIANNVIKRHYFKKKKSLFFTSKISHDDESLIEIKDSFDLEQDFITKENAKEVWDYVKNKDLATAKIFYLYFVFGMKITEVANELSIKESSVKSKIYRTLKELKKNLGKDVMSNDK